MASDLIFSPDLPARVRKVLASEKNGLLRIDEPLPPRDPAWAFVLVAGWNGLIRLAVGLVGSLVFGGGTLIGVGIVAFLLTSTSTALWLTIIPTALALLGGFGFAQWTFGDEDWLDQNPPYKRSLRYARRYHRQYVAIRHLDKPAQDLLERAGTACTAILDSRVHRAGLLDDIANQIVLPAELWQIAQLLQRQTTLEAQQTEAAALADTPQLEAVLKPQKEALRTSRKTVTAKIEALEEYARRVALADSVHAATQYAETNDQYLALLAHTDDRTALADLSTDADDLHRVLADVHQAAALFHPEPQPGTPDHHSEVPSQTR